MNKLKNYLFKLFAPSLQTVVTEPIDELSNAKSRENWLMDGYSWIPDWKKVLGDDWNKWQELISAPREGPKVLISTSMGGNSLLTPLETLFAVALTLRGANVHFLLCDKVLAACQNCYASNEETQKSFVKNGPSLCDWCFDVGKQSIGQLGLPLHLYGDLVGENERNDIFNLAAQQKVNEIENFSYLGVDLGDSVRSATLRFFGKCDITDEPLSLPVLQRYLASAMTSTLALTRLYEKYNFEHTLSNQGLYVPQANIVSVAHKFKSHLVTWDVAYRKLCVHFGHGDAIIKTSGNEPNEEWENIFWNKDVKDEIIQYLADRWSGGSDWQHNVTGGLDKEPAAIAKELGLDPNKPTIGLLTNVIWDAQITYAANAFNDQLEWLLNSVEYFKNRQDLQLLIRVHPAELKSWIESRQFAIDEIRKKFGKIPANVFIIPPESKMNTYKAMTNCNAVVVYGTVAGLEISCMGIPVIVAGQAWLRNKGISTDVSSPEEYKNILDSLPFKNALDEQIVDRALKYAYHFYMRTVLPIGVVDPLPYENAPYLIREQPLSAFARGQDEGLDIACDGILNSTPFIYPAEKKWACAV